MADQFFVPHYTPCELRAPLRRPSGAGSGQIRLLISRLGQKNPRLGARGGGVDRDGLYRLAWPKAADSGILHPRRPRSSSVGCRRRQSRCRSRAGGPSHMLGAPRRRRRPWSWRSSDGRSPAIRARGVCWRPSPALSGARGRAQGRGAAREGRGSRASARRGASGSGSGSRRPRGRCPWAGRQGLGDPGAGRGTRRADSGKRWRSSAIRYFRPRASTSWTPRIRRDISLDVVSTVALPQGPT